VHQTSLLIAIIISGFALGITNRPRISFSHLSLGAILLGPASRPCITSALAAIQITRYHLRARPDEPGLLAASVPIAIAVSSEALWPFFHLRSGRSWLMRLTQLGAAFAMGLAISGMHYTGMRPPGV
jgi:NO-binding membrane sensor protein with MHYT domain